MEGTPCAALCHLESSLPGKHWSIGRPKHSFSLRCEVELALSVAEIVHTGYLEGPLPMISPLIERRHGCGTAGQRVKASHLSRTTDGSECESGYRFSCHHCPVVVFRAQAMRITLCRVIGHRLIVTHFMKDTLDSPQNKWCNLKEVEKRKGRFPQDPLPVRLPTIISAPPPLYPERLAHSPPTKANQAQSPAGSPDFRKWESCRTMPLVGGSSRGSPVSPDTSFRRRSIFISITLVGCQDLACSLPQRSTFNMAAVSVYISMCVSSHFLVMAAASPLMAELHDITSSFIKRLELRWRRGGWLMSG
ncbi:hypothetical protein PR048_005551 [Dryococelus australis]|uniref:Uncharacterized protein n=1 Tax=Dryococelus australis TaxID=614101 RepID=A0ABQ9I8K6_9NEOP|nr:hypothetical protein PR048_005551 [Dryococelus australis]